MKKYLLATTLILSVGSAHADAVDRAVDQAYTRILSACNFPAQMRSYVLKVIGPAYDDSLPEFARLTLEQRASWAKLINEVIDGTAPPTAGTRVQLCAFIGDDILKLISKEHS